MPQGDLWKRFSDDAYIQGIGGTPGLALEAFVWRCVYIGEGDYTPR